MPSTSAVATKVAPLRSPLLTVVAAWLVPGLGHFLLGKKTRAALVCACVAIAFFVGVLMRGPMFQLTPGGDVLSRLIQFAGLFGNMAVGALYFIAVGMGYWPPDVPTHTADYGSKFLVAAGLLNVLAIVDAYEIATRQKE